MPPPDETTPAEKFSSLAAIAPATLTGGIRSSGWADPDISLASAINPESAESSLASEDYPVKARALLPTDDCRADDCRLRLPTEAGTKKMREARGLPHLSNLTLYFKPSFGYFETQPHPALNASYLPYAAAIR